MLNCEMDRNEAFVGEGVRKSGVPREDIFVVSKVCDSKMGHEVCSQSVKDSLSRCVGLLNNYILKELLNCIYQVAFEI